MPRVPLLTSLALLLLSCLLIPLTGCGTSVASTETGPVKATATEAKESPSTTPVGSGKAFVARQQAADEGKYLFVLCTRVEDKSTATMRSTFEKAVAQVADRANAITVKITDPGEKTFVEEFGLGTAPMPLVLTLAPNGAITGGFPTQCTEQDLLSAFATPATEKCMKSLQAGKLVFLCVQNDKTKLNDEAKQGVNGFAADERYREATEIVSLDPTDEAEAPFLKDLQVDAGTGTAITVFLAPPGSPIAMYEGATKKEQLVAELEKAGACGPGGCGPGGCK